MVISTNTGLWRYKMVDTIEFTSTDPYRIRIVGRTKHFINVFGEELMIDNAIKALAVACERTDAEINDWTVAPRFGLNDELGKHEWVIEFERPPKNIAYFTELLDNALKSFNSDYEAKRYKGLVLSMPIIN